MIDCELEDCGSAWKLSSHPHARTHTLVPAPVHTYHTYHPPSYTTHRYPLFVHMLVIPLKSAYARMPRAAELERGRAASTITRLPRAIAAAKRSSQRCLSRVTSHSGSPSAFASARSRL